MTENLIDSHWIREQLTSSGRTQRQLASYLGIDSSGVSRLIDGTRRMKIEEIALVRAFFDVALPPVSKQKDKSPDKVEPDARNVRHRPGPKPRIQFRDDLPVYVMIPAAQPPFWDMQTVPPVEYRACPPQLSSVSGAFALYVPDDTLAPRCRTGEVIYIHPNKPPSFGLDVFVRFRSPNARIAILRYMARSGTRLHFISVNDAQSSDSSPPQRSMQFNEAEIVMIGSIVLTASN